MTVENMDGSHTPPCDCGMPHLSGTEHADECPNGAAWESQQVAPGVVVQGPRVRRVLHSGDPRGDDYREAEAWVRDIRSRLGHIRGELEDVGRIENERTCGDVAGALTLAIRSLHDLVDDGKCSFGPRADRVDALWADVAADPDAFVIEDGESRKWRPWGIFKRGGRA